MRGITVVHHCTDKATGTEISSLLLTILFYTLLCTASSTGKTYFMNEL